jgi:hypothetical protein
MMKIDQNEVELNRFINLKDSLKSCIVLWNGNYYVDFYKDEILFDSILTTNKSMDYMESIAKNFVNGNIRLDKTTWRLHGVF